jgi:hypothetical protein
MVCLGFVGCDLFIYVHIYAYMMVYEEKTKSCTRLQFHEYEKIYEPIGQPGT